MNKDNNKCTKCQRECPSEFHFCPDCDEPLTDIAKENRRLKEQNIVYEAIIKNHQNIKYELDKYFKNIQPEDTESNSSDEETDNNTDDSPSKKEPNKLFKFWVLMIAVAFLIGIVLAFIF